MNIRIVLFITLNVEFRHCLYTKESRSRDVAVGIEDRRGNCHLLIDVAVRTTDGRGSLYS
jgi:hypothetical protein